MCKGLIGRKLGMAGVYSPDGVYTPVTVVEAGPCVVTQIKTAAKDGYNALQLGFDVKPPARTNKPMQGHFQKSGSDCFRYVREVAVEDPAQFEVGQTVALELFDVGERIEVTGTTKGRGFAGVIKRHGFSGGRMTHGSHCKRIPGSIGASAWPGKVFKGKKMPGQYGHVRQTVRNLEIVDIRSDENLLLIKGAVPGPRSGVVLIKKTGGAR